MKISENWIENSNKDLINEYQKLKELYPIIKWWLFKYENWVNTSIFFRFLWYKKEEFSQFDAKYILEHGDRKINLLIRKLEWIKKEIQKNDLQGKIFYNKIENIVNYLHYVKAGLIFETEKAWKDINWMEDLKEKALQELEKYNTILYWESLLTKPEWTEKIYAKVFSLYHNNKWNRAWLTSQEKSTITNFLNKLSKHVKNKKLSVSNMNEILEKEIWPQTEKKDILNKKLSVQQAKKIFELVLEIYSKIFWVKFSQEITIENRNSVSVNFEKLQLIDKEYTIYHIIKLISHEVEKHITKYKNMEKNFDKIQEPHAEMEESTAVIFENIVLENKIPLVSKMVPITISGELFDKEKDIKNFISAYLKLLWDDTSMVDKRFQRIKQWYPYYKKWALRKWVVYSTWIPKVMEFIKKWESKKLFLWAFSYNTLKNTQNIEDYFQTIVYPVLLAEVLKYIIDNDLIDEILNWKAIATKKLIKHLQKKYWQFGIDIEQEISKLNKLKRENKDKIPEIQWNTRERIIEILDTIKN